MKTVGQWLQILGFTALVWYLAETGKIVWAIVLIGFLVAFESVKMSNVLERHGKLIDRANGLDRDDDA